MIEGDLDCLIEDASDKSIAEQSVEDMLVNRSLASPIVAATFALAGGSYGVEYPALTLYRHLATSGLHDIVTGSNWGCAKKAGCTGVEEAANCSGELICNAGPGYDGPTGVGTPDGLTAFGGGTPEPPPTVTAVTPARGPAVGGETVTIEGSHLKDAERVRFGTEKATILADEEESITVETPAHAPEVVDLTVVGSAGTHSAISDADHYEYFVVTPSVSAGPASIVTMSPEHEPGQVDVTVEGPWAGKSHTSPDDVFTYPSPPPPPEADIDLTMSGSGHGVVFGMPSGQFCDSSCSGTAPEGTQLYLNATATNGSNFLGWSGAGCSGTGLCVVTLIGDVTVTADFKATGATVPSGSPGGEGPPAATSPVQGALARNSRVVGRGAKLVPQGRMAPERSRRATRDVGAWQNTRSGWRRPARRRRGAEPARRSWPARGGRSGNAWPHADRDS